MPGYVIHLTEARMVYDILENSRQKISEKICKRQEAFYYGSLLPDAGGKVQKRISHFWNKTEYGQIIMTPDINRFLKKYSPFLKENSLYVGYLLHLYLDREFWLRYIGKNVEFRNSAGESTDNIQDLKAVWIKKNNDIVTPEEFFSEDYLYGDYTKLNKMMIQKYQLVIPVYTQSYGNKIEDAANEKMKNVLEYLRQCIVNSPICLEEDKLRVITLDTFEAFLKDVAYEFVELYYDYLK